MQLQVSLAIIYKHMKYHLLSAIKMYHCLESLNKIFLTAKHFKLSLPKTSLTVYKVKFKYH